MVYSGSHRKIKFMYKRFFKNDGDFRAFVLYYKNKMDAPCKVQDGIHEFGLVHDICSGFRIHIIHIIFRYIYRIFVFIYI